MTENSVRVRGSMDIPSSVRMVSEDHWWGSTHWQRSFAERDYDCFTDIYQPYGTGVWPYKPCTRIKSRSKIGKIDMPDSYGYTCFQTGRFYDVQRVLHGRILQDYFSDNPCYEIDSSAVLCPRELINRVWGRIEGRLPDLKGDAPDLTVFFSEIGEIRRMFDFLREKVIARELARELAGEGEPLARKLAGGHLTW